LAKRHDAFVMAVCERHGEREHRFLCQHLTPESRGLGFVIDQRDGESAWCLQCDLVWEAQGDEWNATVEKQVSIKLVCDLCFAEIREANEAA
jgi:hypothetical protein